MQESLKEKMKRQGLKKHLTSCGSVQVVGHWCGTEASGGPEV